jgi:hypothetical protein
LRLPGTLEWCVEEDEGQMNFCKICHPCLQKLSPVMKNCSKNPSRMSQYQPIFHRLTVILNCKSHSQRCTSHIAWNIFVMCHELAGFFTNIQMYTICYLQACIGTPSNMPKFVCSQKDMHHDKRTAASYNPLCCW